MAFQVQQTGRIGFRQESLVQSIVCQHKGYIHPAAADFFHRVAVEVAAINETIQLFGLALVDFGHIRHPTLLLEPLEHQPSKIPGVSGRGVIHAAVVCMGLIVEHGGHMGAGLAEQVFADNHQRQARGADVFLGTGVDHAKTIHIHRTGQNGGAHVRHQRGTTHFRDKAVFQPPNCFVGAVMQVSRVSRQLPTLLRGHHGEIAVFAAGRHIDLAVAPRFLDGFLGPLPGIDVIRRFTLAQQVHGHHGKLGRRPALQEQHSVIVADAHQVTQVLFGLFGDIHEDLVPVAHFHDGQTFALEIEDFLLSLFQYRRRQRRRPCAEVIGAGHLCSPSNQRSPAKPGSGLFLFIGSAKLAVGASLAARFQRHIRRLCHRRDHRGTEKSVCFPLCTL